MNDAIKAIKERRAVRSYKNKPIEKEKINEIHKNEMKNDKQNIEKEEKITSNFY